VIEGTAGGDEDLRSQLEEAKKKIADMEKKGVSSAPTSAGGTAVLASRLARQLAQAEKERDEAKQALGAAGSGGDDAAELISLRNKVKQLEQNSSKEDPRVAQLQDEVQLLKYEIENTKSVHQTEVAKMKTGSSASIPQLGGNPKEVEALKKRITELEEERDALLETIEKLKAGEDEDFDEKDLLKDLEDSE
jgi:chromosome segregation ATPase